MTMTKHSIATPSTAVSRIVIGDSGPELVLAHVCFVEGDPTPPVAPPPPPAPPGTEKAFTQADVDRIVKDRVRSFADYDTVKAQAARAQDLASKLEEMQTRFDLVGKSPAEADVLQLRKERDKLVGQVADLGKAAEENSKAATVARDQLHSHVRHNVVTDALTKSGVYAPAIDHAARAFAEDSSAELVPDPAKPGAWLVTMRVAGRVYDSAAEAAKAWLALNPHFAAAPSGGTGSMTPNGASGGRPVDIDKLPVLSLIAAGLTNAPLPRR